MTVINQSELAELTTLDQVLMWSIVSINASNLDSRNNYISDNAAIRAESANYIQWSVTQDDNGRGKFIYTALLPVVNPHPLKNKNSIIEKILSYSPFDPDMQTESGINGYGFQLPNLPAWIQTTEQILAYAGVIASQISKYAFMTTGDNAFWENIHPEYWAECQYKISDSAYGGSMILTGTLSIDWHSYLNGRSLIECLNAYQPHASDVNCNFPQLKLLWAVNDVDIFAPPIDVFPLIPLTGPIIVTDGGAILNTEDGAGGLIDSYSQSYFNDGMVPPWLLQAIEDPSSSVNQITGGTNVTGSTTPQLIESLPVCKEQDPSMASYAIQLGNKVQTK
jgi:hypothetical protein